MGLFNSKKKKEPEISEEPKEELKPKDWLDRTEKERIKADQEATEKFKQKHKK